MNRISVFLREEDVEYLQAVSRQVEGNEKDNISLGMRALIDRAKKGDLNELHSGSKTTGRKNRKVS